jgi:hypothetical protein
MPKFNVKNSPEAIAKRVDAQMEKVKENRETMALEPIFEPRCSVCKSPHRNLVDALLAKGSTSYSAIAARVPGDDGKPLDRRAISNHAKNHLGFAEDAIRGLLEAEADEVAQNYEDGVRGALTRRGALEVTLRKAFDDVVSGRIEVEAKDMLAIIQLLEKMDETTNAAQVDYMRAQTSAFIQAIKDEIDDREIWERISTRAKRYMKLEGYELPGETENVQEAEVVDEPEALPPAD